MKWYFVPIVAVLSYVLSTTIFQVLRIHNTLFHTGIILTVILTILTGIRNGLIYSAIYALLIDLFVSKFLGLNLLLLPSVALAVHFVSVHLYNNSITMPALMFVLGTVAYHAAYYIIMFLFRSALPIASVFDKFLIEVVYNLVVGYLIYFLLFRFVKGFRLGDNNV
ncbi:MAG: hypothetical protein Q4A52_04395 [Bacillota bacterium]|nr:hypothetical protein [Bacillota bacterium]